LIAFLAGVLGLVIGVFSPLFFVPAQQARQAEQAFLDPPTQTPAPTSVPLVLPRPQVAQTAIAPPPTLFPSGTVTPVATPVVHTFVIPLRGGGEMAVLANSEDAARNNVKSSGATPAD
jgi:hypothetical protein